MLLDSISFSIRLVPSSAILPTKQLPHVINCGHNVLDWHYHIISTKSKYVQSGVYVGQHYHQFTHDETR